MLFVESGVVWRIHTMARVRVAYVVRLDGDGFVSARQHADSKVIILFRFMTPPHQ